MIDDDWRAKIFEDGTIPGTWHVAKLNEDGGYYKVVVTFGGRYARRNASDYARLLDEPYR
jgi:hypothetical protein